MNIDQPPLSPKLSQSQSPPSPQISQSEKLSNHSSHQSENLASQSHHSAGAVIGQSERNVDQSEEEESLLSNISDVGSEYKNKSISFSHSTTPEPGQYFMFRFSINIFEAHVMWFRRTN